jgi:C-terminal processing protease CtpA/Prc
VAALGFLLSGVAGGFFGSSAQVTQDQVSQQYRVFTAALAAIDRPTGWSTAPITRHAADARSAFELLRSAQYAQMRERQEGRYYGLGISIQAIDGDITVMSRLRRLAGLQEGHPPRRRHRAIEGEDAKGWTTEQAVKQAARAEGHLGQHLDQAPRLRQLIDMDVSATR